MSDSQAPLTAAMFHVLLSLADGEKHGYAISKRWRSRPRARCSSARDAVRNHQAPAVRGPGRGIAARPVEGDDQRRRYYRLTDAGRQVAVTEVQRMEKLLARARSKRLLKAFKPA